MEEQTCIKCGVTMPLSEYYAHPQMARGVLGKCKGCCRTYAKRRHREKIVADPEWREKERRRSREKYHLRKHGWVVRCSDPLKRAAHVLLGNAVRDKRVVPLDNCEDCGHDFSTFRREGHHEDYTQPLEVVWLCSLCHGKRHRGTP